MIQVAVVSGKGGTGKTILTASLAYALSMEKVLIDADVDAANLALLVHPERVSSEEFRGMDAAVIDQQVCTTCGQCFQTCAFHAIEDKGERFDVIPYRCEGCGTCTLVCPEKAISLKPRVTGMIYTGLSSVGPVFYSSLTPGCGNSGLLVHQLRQKASVQYPEISLVLIDGPPGIGCPVVSTISGIHIAVLVTEPSKSAQSDLFRLIRICRQFHVRMFLVINRSDVHTALSNDIIRATSEQNIPLLGTIPYDPEVIEATRKGVPVIRERGIASQAIHQIAQNLMREIEQYDIRR